MQNTWVFSHSFGLFHGLNFTGSRNLQVDHMFFFVLTRGSVCLLFTNVCVEMFEFEFEFEHDSNQQLYLGMSA